jgi:hypothetical protein
MGGDTNELLFLSFRIINYYNNNNETTMATERRKEEGESILSSS